LLNKTTSIKIFLDFKIPIMKTLEYMDALTTNKISFVRFDLLVKEQIDFAENNLDSGKEKTKKIENIKKAYNLKNLRINNFVLVDDSNETFSFVTYIEDMFRDLADSMKVKPITNRVFIGHHKQVKDILADRYRFQSFNENEESIFLEDIQNILNHIKQDFEKNKRVIIERADNLSSFLENNKNEMINREKIMKEIINLCDKYVEPFFSFLKTVNNPDGFMSALKELNLFFIEIDRDVEAMEIKKFMINYKSYYQDISNIYKKINDYRRKGQDDLVIYNSFESAFNNLQQFSSSIQDGLLINNHLEATDYQSRFDLLNDIKINNFKTSSISANYSEFVDRFLQIENSLLIEAPEDSIDENSKIIDENIINERKKIDDLFAITSKLNADLTQQIACVIGEHITILKEKDYSFDLITKIHKILKVNIADYEPFFTVYAYNSLRKNEITNVRVGFNERKKITVNNVIYEYRPIYSMGE
jgi:hypothetical protein